MYFYFLFILVVYFSDNTVHSHNFLLFFLRKLALHLIYKFFEHTLRDSQHSTFNSHTINGILRASNVESDKFEAAVIVQ